MSWRRYLRRAKWDEERAQEMEAHLAIETEENIARGMTPEEARFAAHRKLGNETWIREEIYEMNSIGFLETVWQDIRFAVRLLKKTPVITTVALLSLALGIGANTAIFSLMNSVMLRMLPVPNPEQLVELGMRTPQSPIGVAHVYSNPIWEQLRDHQDVFSGILSWSTEDFDLADGGEAHIVHGIYTSGGYFTTLGVQPAMGRLMTRADDQRGCSGVAVLGYGFWQEHYSGSESAMGSLLRLDSHSFQVVGVTPASFFGTEVGKRFDVAIPLCAEAVLRGKDSFLDEHSAWWLRVVGRLKPGMSAEQAAVRLNVFAPQVFAASVPNNWRPADQASFIKRTFAPLPAGTGLSGLRLQYERPLEILMGIVGLVLLIACANIASLMLARSAARQKETAVRLSLGASRVRLVRQVLTESILLSCAGDLLGILFAKWGQALLVRFVSTTSHKVFLDLTMDVRVLGFTIGIGVLTGLVFGAWPAIRGTRVSLVSAIKGGETQNSKGHVHFHSGRWIVALQVALSSVLLVGTGLFVRTFGNLVTLDPGFDRNGVLLMTMDVHNANIAPAALLSAYGGILDRLQSLPGVISASQTWFTPISGTTWDQEIKVEGYQPPAGVEPTVDFNWVTPDYFSTLRTPLLAGHTFGNGDTPTSSPVAIVNETMARRFYPNANPLGKYFVIPHSHTTTAQPIQIVGVVKDSKFDSIREETLPFAYVPLNQMAYVPEHSSFEIRTAANPSAMIPAVRDVIGGMNKAASLEFLTLARVVDDSLAQERLLATLSGFFGGLALLLTAIGLYGVMSYVVTQRMHEIGIRMALGAQPRSILRLVMRDVALLLAAGAGAGVLGSLWATRVLQQFLYGLKSNDAATILLAVAALVAVALCTSYIPARRAMRVDPMAALRHE
jgi:putative ABC transport system permease protein